MDIVVAREGDGSIPVWGLMLTQAVLLQEVLLLTVVAYSAQAGMA